MNHHLSPGFIGDRGRSQLDAEKVHHFSHPLRSLSLSLLFRLFTLFSSLKVFSSLFRLIFGYFFLFGFFNRFFYDLLDVSWDLVDPQPDKVHSPLQVLKQIRGGLKGHEVRSQGISRLARTESQSLACGVRIVDDTVYHIS